MLSRRQERILLAVVKEYITTAQPVGSGILFKKYSLNISPATIRNEMTLLEELGYIKQLHISSGRIPQDKAYRLYVDKLLSSRIIISKELKDISKTYFEGVDRIEDLIEKTCGFLSEVTSYTSLVLAPQLRRSLLKYLRIITIDSHSLLLIMLTNTGKVINRRINFSYHIDDLDLNKLTNLLNDKLKDIPISSFCDLSVAGFLDKPHQEVLEDIKKNIDDLIELEDNKVFHEDAFYLTNIPEFNDLIKIKKLIGLLKEERLITEVLGETLEGQGLRAYIGYENKPDIMKDFSIIATTYEFSGKVIGGLGIIGPTRMPYEEIISTVSYIAYTFSNKLKEII